MKRNLMFIYWLLSEEERPTIDNDFLGGADILP
jgi:hypothetical protein